jgi:sulfoxide reductase heme-binding subunit YedZ
MVRRRIKQPLPWLKPAILVGALTPLAGIIVRGIRGNLGANPIGEALNQLGLLALIFIVAALACTPLKTVFGWTWPLRVRRMLGVIGSVYAALHVSTYVGLDQVFDWAAIYADVTKRKFIFIGFTAFITLVPLAITSTDAMVKRLGFVRWKRLHRLAYLAPLLAVIHFVWRVKKDVREPVTYAVALGVLLAVRVGVLLQARLRLPAPQPLRETRTSPPGISHL